jgi:hypothetical protein
MWARFMAATVAARFVAVTGVLKVMSPGVCRKVL